jgi:UDP-N-acetylmuramate dehydrogenase
VPLAPLTTFELGGPARHFVTVKDDDEVRDAIFWARDRHLSLLVLGGGSNLVVGDDGFEGLVMSLEAMRGVSFHQGETRVEVTAAAGEPWDPLVATCVERGLAGLECLSGIPGCVGATPIQNVGAYGQEVSETLRRLRVYDRALDAIYEMGPADCELSYRNSRFKRLPNRYVVLSVTYALEPGGAPAVRYAELERRLEGEEAPSLSRVREAVLELRRNKSMVIDPDDDNRRSAGSFFTNPILDDAEAQRVIALAVSEGIVDDAKDVPRYPAGEGRTKLAAGWLIERAGIAKGHQRGSVRVSTKHALALTHLGGGTTEELLALAREVRDAVQERFGVTLVPEPRLIGCTL